MTNRFSVLLGTSVLAASLISFSATEVKAAALCSAGTVNYNGSGYTSCAGAFEGNLNPTAETNFLNTGSGLFGINDWVFDKKINTPGAVENGTNFLGFSITPTTGTTSGTWGFSNTTYTGPVVLSLKASTDRSYYYFDSISGANSLLGTWNTNGTSTNKQGTPQGLSHASLFYVEGGTAVPEPLTMLGAGAAAGFGAFFKKRLAKAQKKDI